MNQLLVAVDGSENANRAIDAAATLAKVTNAKLLVMTVGHELATKDISLLAHAEGGVGEAYECVHNQILHRAKTRAIAKGAPYVEVQLGWGDPAETIIETARRTKADLLVVGRRGRGKLASLLLGSVSHKLVSLAPCIVAVVP